MWQVCMLYKVRTMAEQEMEIARWLNDCCQLQPTMVLSMLMTIIYIYFLLGSGRCAFVCGLLIIGRISFNINHSLLFGYFISFYLRFYVHCAHQIVTNKICKRSLSKDA